MNRRHFLERTSRAAVALPFVRLAHLVDGAPMGIIVHSYANRWHSEVESDAFPGFKNALDLIDHCHAIGAGGVQVMVRDWTQDFGKRVRDRREKYEMYLEGSIALPKGHGDKNRFEQEVIAAREAGASVVRTVCLSGRRYETFQSRDAFVAFKKDSIASLQLAESVVRKHQVKLAVENHKDWRATELVTILKNLDSEWVGVNLDFGNNIALMEDPMEVARLLAPYVFTTHVKDMGVAEYADGFLLSEVPLGRGFLDLKAIYTLCRKENSAVNFNLEMITRDPLKIPCLTENYWATFADVQPEELASMLRTVRQHKFPTPLPTVSHLSPEARLAAEENNVLKSLHHSKKL